MVFGAQSSPVNVVPGVMLLSVMYFRISVSNAVTPAARSLLEFNLHIIEDVKNY